MRHIIKAILLPLIAGFFSTVVGQQFTEVGQQLGVADSVQLQGRGAQWIFLSNQERPDLYVSNSMFYISPWQPTPNRLYINQTSTGAGFVDQAADRNIAVEVGRSMATGWADFDLDTDLDLYVTNGYGFFGAPSVPNQLYQKDGEVFSEIGAAVDVDSIDWNMNSVAWGDYNGDGRPDLYITNNEEPNLLFRNDGTQFTEVADELGVAVDLPESHYNGLWVDYDGDGDLDLSIPVFHYSSHLFQNDVATTGQFTDVTPTVGLDTDASIYHGSWADYDADGDWDLYLCVNGANKLFRNDVSTYGTFTEVASTYGIADSVFSYRSSWTDYDHDGDLDLFVLNSNEPDQLYRNDVATTGQFTEVSSTLGLPQNKSNNMGVAWSDYDADGDLDMYIVNDDTSNFLYRNNQNDSNYLKVRFLSANGSFSRQGSVVDVYLADTDSLVGMRQIDGGGEMWGCQNMYDVHFGLDGAQAYDLVIRSTLSINGQPVVLDKTTRPALGNVIPADIGGLLTVRDTLDTFVGTTAESSDVPNYLTLLPAYPNPFNSTTFIRYSLPASSPLLLRIVNLRGQIIRTLVTAVQPAGEYTISWDGTDDTGTAVASGVYFVHLQLKVPAGQTHHQSQKLLLLK